MGNFNTKFKTKICGVCKQPFIVPRFNINAVCTSCHSYLLQLDTRYYSAVSVSFR